jgi:hypothetical protein
MFSASHETGLSIFNHITPRNPQKTLAIVEDGLDRDDAVTP